MICADGCIEGNILDSVQMTSLSVDVSCEIADLVSEVSGYTHFIQLLLV